MDSSLQQPLYYFDNAATTRPLPDIISSSINLLKNQFANPSSSHVLGVKARGIIETAREKLAAIFNVPQNGIIFCSGGTESINLAIKGSLKNLSSLKLNIISSPLEHAAVLQTLSHLQQQNITIRLLRINQKNGQIDLNHLEEIIDQNTCCVTIQHVNSETGIIQPLQQIASIIKKNNPQTLFHVDGVQAFGKILFYPQKIPADLYSISGHKIHGLKGSGALIIKNPSTLKPLIHGGGQEFGYRSGTENLIAIHSLTQASEYAMQNLQTHFLQVQKFQKLLINTLLQKIPTIQFVQFPEQSPYILSCWIPHLLGDLLMRHLEEQQIFVSQGSACNAKNKELSKTFLALGVQPQIIRNIIRISLAALELPTDLTDFFQRFIQAVQNLQSI